MVKNDVQIKRKRGKYGEIRKRKRQRQQEKWKKRDAQREKKSNFYAYILLSDPEVTANIDGKSRNLPNTNTQNDSTDLR